MTPLRKLEDGLTRPEIREEVRDLIHEETDDKIDKLLDGAQASIYTATLLNGDPALGIRGFIPDVQERLKALEAGAATDRITIESRHTETSGRLDKLEEGQHKIRKSLSAFCSMLFMTEDGKLDWKKISAVFVAASGILHFVWQLVPSWPTIKLFVMKMSMILAKAS